MPRPTAAQFTYGALTVVISTLAMLLLSQTRSGTGIVVVAVAALALGLLVSVTAAAHASTGEQHTLTSRSETRYRTPASLRQ